MILFYIILTIASIYLDIADSKYDYYLTHNKMDEIQYIITQFVIDNDDLNNNKDQKVTKKELEDINLKNFFFSALKNNHSIIGIINIYSITYLRYYRVVEMLLVVYLKFSFSLFPYQFRENTEEVKATTRRSIKDKNADMNALAINFMQIVETYIFSLAASVFMSLINAVLNIIYKQDISLFQSENKLDLIKNFFSEIGLRSEKRYKLAFRRTITNLKFLGIIKSIYCNHEKIIDDKIYDVNSIEKQNVMQKRVTLMERMRMNDNLDEIKKIKKYQSLKTRRSSFTFTFNNQRNIDKIHNNIDKVINENKNDDQKLINNQIVKGRNKRNIENDKLHGFKEVIKPNTQKFDIIQNNSNTSRNLLPKLFNNKETKKIHEKSTGLNKRMLIKNLIGTILMILSFLFTGFLIKGIFVKFRDNISKIVVIPILSSILIKIFITEIISITVVVILVWITYKIKLFNVDNFIYRLLGKILDPKIKNIFFVLELIKDIKMMTKIMPDRFNREYRKYK